MSVPLASGSYCSRTAQQGHELVRVGSGWEASLAGADYCERLSGGKMRQSFFEGAGEICERSARSDSNYGFGETEDAVSGGFESLGGGIVPIAGDDDLERMMREERGGEAVGGSKRPYCGAMPAKASSVFFAKS